ncbi:ankyrin repeat domain-containing protein 7-like [Heliangelus exortis]|uniref:ankyrin repeat domain-containing protein 7-like n=1 Tax=Heliangelus exortis TaxID=472823 RepID=UPI003A947995
MGLFRRKSHRRYSTVLPSYNPVWPRAAAASTSGPEIEEKDLKRLHHAAAHGHLSWLRFWHSWIKIWGIDCRDRENRTPLHLACANGHTEVARFLVEHGSQLDAVDNFGRTPLMKAVQLREQDCVTFLLEQGADTNLADIDGNTALQLAILAHHKNLVRQLIKHGAKLDAKNKKGCTPLTLAITEKHEAILEDLLKAGADVHARDEHERTPLMIAASVGEMYLVKVLLSHGANISHEDKDGRIAVDYADLHGHLRVSQYLAKLEDTAEAPAGDALGSPEQAGAAGGIKEKPDQENRGEAPACDTEDPSIVITPEQAGAAPVFWGAPAVDRGATENLCEGGSIRSSETEMNDITWKDSEDSLLFTPKHLLQGDSAVMGNLSVAAQPTH